MEREILEAVGDAVLTGAVLTPKKADPPRHSGARKGMELFVHTVFLLCGIVAVAFVLFMVIKTVNALHKKPAEPEAPAEPTTKVCPYCQSEIAIKAVRCPHCTTKLEGFPEIND